MTWAAVTSLKPGQACFPRMDCHEADRSKEDVPANEPCPMDLVSLFSAWAHNLQVQEGPPVVKVHPLYPKDVEPLGWKSSEKPHGLHCLLIVGFPPLASFLRVAPPMAESTFPRRLVQELGCVQGMR